MKRTFCLFLSIILLVFLCIPSFAEEETEYTYSTIYWNLAKSTEAYGGMLNGQTVEGASGRGLSTSFSIPLNLDPELNHLYIGAYYPSTLVDLMPGATYKMVITLTLGTSGSYTGLGAHQLFNSALQGNLITKLPRQQLNKKSTMTTDVADTYTFTWDNIEYEKIVGYNFIWTDISLSNFDSYMTDELYIVSSYFGLSSYFDENKYKAEVTDNLNEISGKLDNIQGAVDEAGDKVVSELDKNHQEQMDQSEEQHEETKGLLETIISGITSIPEKIKNVFKNLFDEIIGSVTESISNAMNDFLDDLTDKLGILYQAPDYFVRIIESIMTTETSNEIIFPSMVIPVGEEEYTLNEPTPFQIFPDWIPAEVYTFINLAFSIAVIIAVINYADHKWEDITENG